MKSVISVFVIIFIISSNIISAQIKAETVHSITRIYLSNDWYKKQSELWKKEIDKNPNSAEAWMNYYRAVRYTHFEGTSDFAKDKQSRLNNIVDNMGKYVPDSYEYLFLRFFNSDQNDKSRDLHWLKKAYQLNPERPEAYTEFISFYELEGNYREMKKFNNLLYKSKYIPDFLVEYNYNVLQTTEKNAILFTNGDNDTYPVWMLQQAKGLRNDVTVLNAHMIINKPDYLKRKLKESGMRIDFENLPKNTDKQFLSRFCNAINEKYPDIPLYFALTVYKNYIDEISDNLYLVGMANQFSMKRIDNFALMKNNVENNYRLDYLTFDWYNEDHISQGINNSLNVNYALVFIKLAEHYAKAGKTYKALELKKLSRNCAEKAGSERMLEYIKSADF